MFSAFDNIVNRGYSPSLPEIPFEVDDDEGVAVKVVTLLRGTEPLGATIKCDSTGAVFIARVIAGGVADRSACIQVLSWRFSFSKVISRLEKFDTFMPLAIIN